MLRRNLLIGLMFGFNSGLWQTITFGTAFEITVYVYGLSLAAVYITQFWKTITSYIRSRTGQD